MIKDRRSIQQSISGSGSSGGSGGYSYDPNDELYSSHDYNHDGYMSDQELQDATNDYIDQLLYGS